MQPWDTDIAAAAEKVAEEFAERIDPEEKTYNSYLSLKDVRLEIEEVLQAAIADWLIEKRDAQHEQRLEEAAYDLEDAAYEQARDEAMQATGVDEEHEAMMADRPEGRGLPF